MGRWGETDPFYVTPEDEAVFERQAEEQELADWLASWSDDFHSDEWLAALDD